MKNTYKQACIIFSLLLILASACKKKDDPTPDTPAEPFKSTLAERQAVVEIPDAFANNNSNNYAIETRRYIGIANSTFGLYQGFLNIPATTTPNGDGSWTWSDGAGNTVTYTSVLSGNEYKVTMRVKYSTGLEYKVYDATEAKDGSKGNIRWYDDEGKVALTIEWTYANGIFTNTLVSGSLRIVSTSNDNLSGTIKYYEDGVLLFEGQWQTNGSGDCTSYNGDGSQNETGSW